MTAAVSGGARAAAWVVVAGLALLAGCGGSSPEEPTPLVPTPAPTPSAGAAAPVVLDPASFEPLVVASSRPSLVEFQRPTCPHCQSMVPIVERLAADYTGRALVGTVNTTDHPSFAQTHGITGVPTFTFWKGGREVYRRVGTTTYETLAARLNELLASASVPADGPRAPAATSQSVSEKKVLQTGSPSSRASTR